MSKNLSLNDLGHLQLFHGENIESLEWLLDCAQEHWLQTGDVLLEPGENNEKLYLILEGTVQIKLTMDDIISVVGKGDCIGELSALDGKPAGAYVIAEEPCHLLAISRDTLWKLVDTTHVVAKNLLHIMSGRVRSNNETLNESLHLQRSYEERARVDALTGLYNRRWLDEMLPRYVERAQRSDRCLGVMMLDVDNFKHYNDSLGHQAGDQALRVTAATIRDFIRPMDVGVRYGGEEFVVLVPEAEPGLVQTIAERIRLAVEQQCVTSIDGKPMPSITISIGVTNLQKGQDGEAMIAVADRALYQAKDRGRNQSFAM